MSLLKDIWLKQQESEVEYADDLIALHSGNVCMVATNRITGQKLFIIKVSASADQLFFKRRQFQGVSVELLDFTSHREVTIILLDPLLEDIFYLFIDNLFDSIKDLGSEDEVLRVSSNIIFKWKKLFDKIRNDLLTPEQQRGLLGELLFIREMLQEDMKHRVTIENWFGPELYNKDFIISNTGFEVKTTVQNRPAVTISGEKQLDKQDLSNLYLKIFILDEIKGEGITLNGVIAEIQAIIREDLELTSYFEYKLLSAGYRPEDGTEYTTQYRIVRNEIYHIDESFPKIIPPSLPAGIFNCVYHIDIAALDKYQAEHVSIKKLIYG